LRSGRCADDRRNATVDWALARPEKPVAMATEAAEVVWTNRRREREVIFCLLKVFWGALVNFGVLSLLFWCSL
jgi:hypothetical protein